MGGREWRPTITKKLDAVKIKYFNPRLPPGCEWTPAHREKENKLKEKSQFQVYVITNDAYGLVSIFEVYQMGKQGKNVYVHLEAQKDYPPKWPVDPKKPIPEITKRVFGLRQYIRDAVKREKLKNVLFFDGKNGVDKLANRLIGDWKKKWPKKA